MTSSSTQLSQFSQITITHNDITNEVYRTTVSSVTSVNRHIWPNFYRLLRLVGSQDRTHDRTFRSRSFRSRSRSFRFGLRSSVNYAQSECGLACWQVCLPCWKVVDLFPFRSHFRPWFKNFLFYWKIVLPQFQIIKIFWFS